MPILSSRAELVSCTNHCYNVEAVLKQASTVATTVHYSM